MENIKLSELIELSKMLNQTDYLKYIGISILKFKRHLSNLSDGDINELIFLIDKVRLDTTTDNSESLASLLDIMIEKGKQYGIKG